MHPQHFPFFGFFSWKPITSVAWMESLGHCWVSQKDKKAFYHFGKIQGDQMRW
jgi:hypothetical protein